MRGREVEKGKGPASTPSSPERSPKADRGLGLTLTRTIRVGEDLEDGGGDGEGWEDDEPTSSPVAAQSTAPVRPPVRRSGSTIKSMRQMLFSRNRSPDSHPPSTTAHHDRGRTGHQTKESSRSTSPSKSISFAAHSRPSKHSPGRPPGIIARAIPAKLGGAKASDDLRMSRTNTSGSIRFAD